MDMKNFNLGLYLVTNSDMLKEDEFLQKIEEACQAGVTLVQLREKEKTGAAFCALAQKVKAVTDQYAVPLIINDRVDIAMAIDAAGVHLGQGDIPVEVARRLLGPEKIIGATTKTMDQAMRAKIQGADYLGVGAIFPTKTKVKTLITSVETLNRISEATELPIVAIGGLNQSNLDMLKGSRANGIAVVSAIMNAKDTQKAVADLKDELEKILEY